MAKRLTLYILIGLVLGGIVGWGLHWRFDDGTPESAKYLTTIAHYFLIVTTVFLRLIKMIIAPLVFSTLVVGIAHMGDTGALGRVGLRSLGWFICASLMSLSLGLLMFHLSMQVASWFDISLTLTLPTAEAGVPVATDAFSIEKFVTHIVPSSMIDAMATNEIIQIVVFSVFFGVALTAIGEKAAPIVRAIEGLVAIMLQITSYVMRFAPFAVFGAVAATLTESGPSAIGKLGFFMASFYTGLAVLWALLIGLGFLFIGRRIVRLIGYVRAPVILAFTTASSEAAYPRTLEALDRFGVPPKIASFVLPLGYSFNLDGSMMYMTFASLFIAHAYNIPLSIGQQITMLLILMVTSKGIACVPRASLVVIAATLPLFNIPEYGLGLILAVDHFLDMGRSATNVVGNAVAASVVAKWEGGFDAPEPPEAEPPHAPSHGLSGHG